MVDAQLALTIITGIFSGFIAGYIVKWGDEIREIYRKLGVPKRLLSFMEIMTTLLIMLLYWILIIVLID